MIKDQESHGLTYNKDYNEITIRLFRKKLEKEYGAQLIIQVEENQSVFKLTCKKQITKQLTINLSEENRSKIGCPFQVKFVLTGQIDRYDNKIFRLQKCVLKQQHKFCGSNFQRQYLIARTSLHDNWQRMRLLMRQNFQKQNKKPNQNEGNKYIKCFVDEGIFPQEFKKILTRSKLNEMYQQVFKICRCFIQIEDMDADVYTFTDDIVRFYTGLTYDTAAQNNNLKLYLKQKFEVDRQKYHIKPNILLTIEEANEQSNQNISQQQDNVPSLLPPLANEKEAQNAQSLISTIVQNQNIQQKFPDKNQLSNVRKLNKMISKPKQIRRVHDDQDYEEE